MALFFYRGWSPTDKLNTEDKGPSIDPLSRDSTIFHTRWGYAALLLLTMVSGLALNILYLSGYRAAPRAGREVPHVCLVWLAVRDILVCLVMFPVALDWCVIQLSQWNRGDLLCSVAGFFDFYLNSLYPMLLVVLVIVLYSRKLWKPPVLPGYQQGGPLAPPPATLSTASGRHSRSGYSSHQQPVLTDRPPSHNGALAMRPPSVAGSVQSHRSAASSQPGGFRKGFAKTPRGGTGPGSTHGSLTQHQLATPLARPGSVQEKYMAPPARTSSPLGMLRERPEFRGDYPASLDGSDLWDAASLDYPGREEDDYPGMDMEDDFDPNEPRLREWLKWVAHACWILALGFGVVAGMTMNSIGAQPPGCYVRANPFASRYNYPINDPGFNFLMANTILTFLIAALFMIIMGILLCTTRWTKDSKLNRYMKLCIGLILVFLVTRCPLEIIQFKELIHAAEGFKFNNIRPDQLEHELLIIWAALLPTCLNPIMYLFCVSEYRKNIVKSWRICRGLEKSPDDLGSELGVVPAIETKETDVL